MPQLYRHLSRRFAPERHDQNLETRDAQDEPRGCGRHAAERSAATLCAGQTRGRRRRGLQRPHRRLRAVEGRLRRHRRRSPRPRRRPRRELRGSRGGQERRGRRRARRIEPSHVGGVRRPVQAGVPRRVRVRGLRLPDHSGRPCPQRGGRRSALGGARHRRERDERGRRRRGRRGSSVDDRQRSSARSADAGAVDSGTQGVRSLQGRSRRHDDGRQRRQNRVAELSRQPRDGERPRAREVLDRLRGVSLPRGQPAARAEAARGHRHLARAALDAGGWHHGRRLERSRPPRQRQDARGRRCDPDGAAVGVEQDRVRAAAAARSHAADGQQRQGPHCPAGNGSGSARRSRPICCRMARST